LNHLADRIEVRNPFRTSVLATDSCARAPTGRSPETLCFRAP
jgi:hypothetical protein